MFSCRIQLQKFELSGIRTGYVLQSTAIQQVQLHNLVAEIGILRHSCAPRAADDCLPMKFGLGILKRVRSGDVDFAWRIKLQKPLTSAHAAENMKIYLKRPHSERFAIEVEPTLMIRGLKDNCDFKANFRFKGRQLKNAGTLRSVGVVEGDEVHAFDPAKGKEAAYYAQRRLNLGETKRSTAHRDLHRDLHHETQSVVMSEAGKKRKTSASSAESTQAGESTPGTSEAGEDDQNIFGTYWFAGTLCQWLGKPAGRLRCTNRALDMEVSPRVDSMLIDKLRARAAAIVHPDREDQQLKQGLEALRTCAKRRYDAIKAALIYTARSGETTEKVLALQALGVVGRRGDEEITALGLATLDDKEERARVLTLVLLCEAPVNHKETLATCERLLCDREWGDLAREVVDSVEVFDFIPIDAMQRSTAEKLLRDSLEAPSNSADAARATEQTRLVKLLSDECRITLDQSREILIEKFQGVLAGGRKLFKHKDRVAYATLRPDPCIYG